LTQLAGLQVSKDSEKTGKIFKKVQCMDKMAFAGRGKKTENRLQREIA